MRKIFTFLCAALMSVGMFATTVTWDSNTLSSINIYDGDSFTQDGVTLTSLTGMIDVEWMGNSNDASFKFSTSLGNFTRIEITGDIRGLGGSGWTQTSPGAVWTGEANETTFGMHFRNVSQIVFTIGDATPEPEPAEKPIVVFEANGNRKEVEVESFPHTFACDFEEENGELDLIIQELYALPQGGYCDWWFAPTATGNAAVTAGADEEDNHFITVSEVFEGTATVSGKYNKYIDLDEEMFTYTLTISVKGDEPTAIINTAVEAKAVKRIVNGMLLIEKNGKFYNVQGAEVK